MLRLVRHSEQPLERHGDRWEVKVKKVKLPLFSLYVMWAE